MYQSNLGTFIRHDSTGGGIRWQVLGDKKLNLGIDVGYSDGESVIFIQAGEKF
jgi:hypothetical protein